MDNMVNRSAVCGRVIDRIGLSAIGIFCLCYSIFWSSFAEIHITVPFLDFPIFVGEILLAVCLLLLVLKWKVTGFCFNPWYYLLGAYMGWIVTRALGGYFSFGPLAFRNAALFYYPLFAVVSYHFFSKEYFSQKAAAVLLIVFLLAKIFVGFIQYFFLPYFALSLILILKIERRWLRYCVCILLLYIFPYQMFFHGSRSFLLGNMAAFLFLILSFVFGVLKIRRKYKILFFLAMLIILAWGTFKFSRSARQVESLMAPGRFMEKFREYDEYVQWRKKEFKPLELKAQLYNENTINFINKALGRAGDAKTQGRQEEVSEQGAVVMIEKKLDSVIEETVAKKRLFDGATLKDTVDAAVEVMKEQKKAFLKVMEDGGSKDVLEKKKQVEEIGQEYKEMLRDYEHHIKKDLADSGKTNTEDIILEKKASVHLLRDAMEGLTQQKEIALKGVMDVHWAIAPSPRTLNEEQGNMLFRIFIWRDMVNELAQERPLFGFSFGKPQRSLSIEILDQAHGEWTRDGWITPHNVFLHVIYRAGIVGILMIAGFFIVLFSLAKEFIQKRAVTGLLLVSILIFWIVVASFLVVLELPYQAIPFWALFGIALAYRETLKDVKV